MLTFVVACLFFIDLLVYAVIFSEIWRCIDEGWKSTAQKGHSVLESEGKKRVGALLLFNVDNCQKD